MIWLLLALAGKSSQKCKVANMPYTGMLHSDLRGQRQQGLVILYKGRACKTKRVDNALLLLYSLQTRNYFTDEHDACMGSSSRKLC